MTQPLTARGYTMSLQFGDRVAGDSPEADDGKDVDGVTRLTIRCSIQVNGGGMSIAGPTHWRIHKDVSGPGAIPDLRFAIDADLNLQGGITVADILRHGVDIYRHLHMLISDASAALYDLSINDRHGGDAGALVVAPVVRIEARFVGDLAAGRSGLLATDGAGDFTHPASLATRHLRITRIACDWLKDHILPDLASTIRRTLVHTQATSRYSAAPANAATLMPEQVQP